MEAHFLSTNPLFYLELRNEEQFYLWGRWWVSSDKCSDENQICSMVPIRMQDCHKQMEKTANEFKAQAHCGVLKQSTSRLFDLHFTTEEKKFKTKVTKVTLAMPREAWLEFKAYRVRSWKASKLMSSKGDDDEKKDDDKKDEKKDE